jgi:hypothetical protein
VILFGSFLADQTQSVIVRLVQIYLFVAVFRMCIITFQGSPSGGYHKLVSVSELCIKGVQAFILVFIFLCKRLVVQEP